MAKSKREQQRRAPVSPLDSVDRHVSVATADDESLKRYQRLLRSTVVWVGGLALAALLIVMAGLAVVFYLAGLSVPAAIGIGAAGTATTLATATVKMRSSLLTAARTLSAPDPGLRSDGSQANRRE